MESFKLQVRMFSMAQGLLQYSSAQKNLHAMTVAIVYLDPRDWMPREDALLELMVVQMGLIW